ncbi:MAG TPA: imidazolonepropionase [bacterium]|nr:imidazolonepropionase [bacterium]
MTTPAPLADLVLINCRQVVTMEGSGDDALGVIENGAVVCKDGKIAWVGPEKDLLQGDHPAPTHQVFDAGGRTVVPGFIDPHTHLIFWGWREDEFEERLQGVAYQEIAARGGGILRTVRETRNASMDQLVRHGLRTLDRMLAYGTTTVEAKSGYGLSTAAELELLAAIRHVDGQHPVDVVATFMGAHEVPLEWRPDTEGYVQQVIHEQLPAVAAQGIAEFCDVFCEAGVFDVDQSRRILEAAKGHGLKPKIHSDEFENLGGTEMAIGLGAVSVDHLHVISEAGIAALAASHSTTGVLLPGTAFYLGGKHYAPVQRMLAEGCRLALATDFNPGSSVSENLQLMNSIAVTQMRMDPIEALRAMTINAAHAVGRQESIGSIRPEKQADLVILDMPNYRHLAYHYGVNQVWAVVKKGQVVVRNQ